MTAIISEYGGLSRIVELLSKFKAKRVFLVTGRGSYSACGAKAILDEVLADVVVERFYNFEVNPKIEDGIRGAEAAKSFKTDLILAVGGGSPMDVAKLIKAFLTDISSAEAMVRGDQHVPPSDCPLICVPTTAGSGSEATHFAVVYIGKDKFSLASPTLLPEGAILDGQLLKTASPYQRAVNGLDAMAQATEGAWAAKSTPDTRALSYSSIEALVAHLPAMVSGNAPEALQAVMVAANEAGQVINVTKTTAPHAFSYAFTSYHNVPHGHAVWMTLPAVFGRHLNSPASAITDPRGEGHFRDIMIRLLNLYKLTSVETAEAELKVFMQSLDVEPDMKRIGANAVETRAFLASKVNRERLGNNPVALSETDIAEIFELESK